jgi:hypothetical protein
VCPETPPSLTSECFANTMSPLKSSTQLPMSTEQKRAEPRHSSKVYYMLDITARPPGPLTVLRVSTLASTIGGAHMPDTPKLNIREWLVPPVLLPIFFALLIAGAVIIQW